jgi:hypothetical protein
MAAPARDDLGRRRTNHGPGRRQMAALAARASGVRPREGMLPGRRDLCAGRARPASLRRRRTTTGPPPRTPKLRPARAAADTAGTALLAVPRGAPEGTGRSCRVDVSSPPSAHSGPGRRPGASAPGRAAAHTTAAAPRTARSGQPNPGPVGLTAAYQPVTVPTADRSVAGGTALLTPPPLLRADLTPPAGPPYDPAGAPAGPRRGASGPCIILAPATPGRGSQLPNPAPAAAAAGPPVRVRRAPK